MPPLNEFYADNDFAHIAVIARPDPVTGAPAPVTAGAVKGYFIAIDDPDAPPADAELVVDPATYVGDQPKRALGSWLFRIDFAKMTAARLDPLIALRTQ